ncbi:MAG: zinc dependent phospholipase C family protein [bacterium]
MPAPITHIVFAIHALKGPFYNKSPKKFIIGTCFPDIRYLVKIPRTVTHPEQKISIKMIKREPSDFKAGWLFHCWLDQQRKFFFTHQKQLSPYEIKILRFRGAKIYEDILFYNDIRQWPTIIDYLNIIIPDEIRPKISLENVQMWHNILQIYFEKQPQTTDANSPITRILNPQQKAETKQHLETIKNSKKLIQVLWNFYEYIKKSLEDETTSLE